MIAVPNDLKNRTRRQRTQSQWRVGLHRWGTVELPLLLFLLLICPSFLHAWKKNPSHSGGRCSASGSLYTSTVPTSDASPSMYVEMARLRGLLRQRRRDYQQHLQSFEQQYQQNLTQQLQSFDRLHQQKLTQQRQSFELQYQQNLTEQLQVHQERLRQDFETQLQEQARSLQSQYEQMLQEQVDRVRQEHAHRQVELIQQNNATIASLQEQHQQQLYEQKMRVKKLLKLIQQMQSDSEESSVVPPLTSTSVDDTIMADPTHAINATTTTKRRKVKRKTSLSQTRSTAPP